MAQPDDGAENQGANLQVVTPGGPDAPALSGTIEGINFDGDATTNGGIFHIPPDNTMAVGPNNVVTVTNCTLQFFTKAGVLQNTQRMGKNITTITGSFFAPLNPVNGLFDPKVMYDQVNNRFVIVALEQTDVSNGGASNSSRVLIAASDDSDPNGTWFERSLNTTITVSGQPTWVDFPGVAIDGQALYVTGNLFRFLGGGGTFQGSRLIIVPTAALYANGSVSAILTDPSGATGLSGAGLTTFAMQPTHMFGGPAGGNTFLVTSGYVDGSNNDFLSVIVVNNAITSPTFVADFVNLGHIGNNTVAVPGATQKNSAQTLEAGDGRMSNAVWRSNILWTTNTIVGLSGADANTPTAHWYKIDTTLLDPMSDTGLVDQGDVGGEDIAVGTNTYYPAINVDSAGNMALGFSASGPNLFPGAYYTGRLAADPAGTVQPAATLAAGVDFYLREFSQNGGTRNRWGDYSEVALDPSNESTFYVYNEYALARGTILSGSSEDGRWGTRIGNFSFVVTQSISGQVFQDNNGNGVFDGGEPTLNGVTVFLDNDNSGTLNAGDTQVTTAGSGNFSFPGLANGTYHLREVTPSGFIRNSTLSDPVLSGSSVVSNIGNFPITFPVAPATGAGNDTYTVQLDASGQFVQINDGSTAYTIAKSTLSPAALTFNGNAGDDTLSVSFVNGSPIPAAGITFAGGTQTTGDALAIIGSASAAETATFNGGNVVIGNTITDSGVETFSFNGNGGSDNVTVNSGSVLFPATQVFSNLTLANGTSAQLTSGANKVLVVSNLSIGTGAVLDLTDEDAIVRLGSSSLINQLAGNGYNGGIWNGTSGIVSSTAAAVAADSSNLHKTALGVAPASATPLVGSFDGQTLNGSDVVIRYTNTGDANLDGHVNTMDFTALASNFGGASKIWSQGDFTFNTIVNALDFNHVSTNFGQALPAPTPDGVFSETPIQPAASLDQPLAAIPAPTLAFEDMVSPLVRDPSALDDLAVTGSADKI
jgi:hypothetical protein